MARGWTGGAALIVLSLARAASAQDSSNLPPAEKYGLRLQYREYRPGLTGEVQKGTTDKDGTVVDVTVEKPSNISLLDVESQRAILKTARLPPLPREFTEPVLTVHLIFEYHR